MSDIRAWLFRPLIEFERRVRLETGTRPRIEITVHPHLFVEAVAELRCGAISDPACAPPGAIHIGYDVIIKPWPQNEPALMERETDTDGGEVSIKIDD